MWLLTAPALMFGYGVARPIDGRDGEYGPGLAWTVGHLPFLAGLLLFGVVFVRLRSLVPTTMMPRKVTASAALALGVARVVAFVRVIILDMVVGGFVGSC
jgi:hypothetical protein